MALTQKVFYIVIVVNSSKKLSGVSSINMIDIDHNPELFHLNDQDEKRLRHLYRKGRHGVRKRYFDTLPVTKSGYCASGLAGKASLLTAFSKCALKT